LLQLFDGELEKIRLQKLLFLFSKRQRGSVYDFVPYQYGCYSFSANADMTAMVKHGQLTESEKTFSRTDNKNYFNELKTDDQRLLRQVHEAYGVMSSSALMRHTYLNFPFYAIKSKVVERVLNEQELDKVRSAMPVKKDIVLFTIGYEGISLEAYLVKLLRYDVKVLVDVRNNPQSMKYGFSKSQLQRFCIGLGIEYIHIPEVGIVSEQRQELVSQEDYDRLFDKYKRDNLRHTTEVQNGIIDLLREKKRIALTCFEADICQCHRKHLAESIQALPAFEFEVQHI
jgi:uncharacterized protein (DUF488 family)